MTNVLLIDLSSIAHPIYHTEIDPSATSTKTVERVRALASGMTRGVGVCVDGGRSFRKDIDPTYKANRPESDAALQHQIAVAIDVLRADGFPILQAKGYEADDCIATSVYHLDAQSETYGHPLGTVKEFGHANVIIASADKDLLALVGPRVSVKSLKDGSIIGPAAVEAKFGVRPDQMLDFLALCGDPSDNIKGCKDVGKVRAAGLLKKYDTLDAIFEAARNPNEFTPALTASILEFGARPSNRQLIRLRTDAPIDVSEVLKERVPIDVATFGDDDLAEAPDATTAAIPSESVTLPSVPNGGDSGHLKPLEVQSVGLHSKAVIDEIAPMEWERQLEPRNMAQMKALAADLFASRLFSAYGHQAGVLSTILAGRELGLPAMAALRAFHIIENRPCLAADFIRALVLQSGVVEYFRCVERTDERATFVAKRKGDPELSLTYTLEDAKRAWQKTPAAWDASGYGRNPADMLIARAGSKLARLVAPDVVSGLYSREEME